MDYLEQNRELFGLPEERLVGREQVVLPYQIIKYCLREGSGGQVQPGMTLSCYLNVFLIDGTQIVSSRASKVTRLLFGRNRLIRGLETGLRGIRKGEKARLVIASEQAYGPQ
jgi:FKBP-type peptidyl-prolyl cis-trans isomerase